MWKLQLNKSLVLHENDYGPPPSTHHQELNVGNISAVTYPILTKIEG